MAGNNTSWKKAPEPTSKETDASGICSAINQDLDNLNVMPEPWKSFFNDFTVVATDLMDAVTKSATQEVARTTIMELVRKEVKKSMNDVADQVKQELRDLLNEENQLGIVHDEPAEGNSNGQRS